MIRAYSIGRTVNQEWTTWQAPAIPVQGRILRILIRGYPMSIAEHSGDISCPRLRFLRRMTQRELGGSDDALKQISPDLALAPTEERLRHLSLELTRVNRHSRGAPHRIQSRIDELASAKRITPNMATAARYYALVASIAEGPSAGVGKYGNGGYASPYTRTLTSDDRLMARVVYDGAKRAAFGMAQDISGRIAYDELALHAIEPILLNLDGAKTMTQLGALLSNYDGENGRSVCGTAEVHSVLRRLRTYFRLGDD